MARPIHADATATRLGILSSAARLFSERGVGRSSIRDIAREAGVSLATVHHYFGSKEGLYEACIDAMYAELEELRDELQPLFLAGAGSETVLAKVVRATFRFGRSHHLALRLVMREVLDTGEMREHRRNRYMVPYLRDGASLLEAVMGGGIPEDIRLVLQSISHLVVRYSLTSSRELAVVCGLVNTVEDSTEAVQKEAVLQLENHLVRLANTLL